MRISIITPHFESGPWLCLCIASVADQKGVEVEHIIQDAGSGDGSLDGIVPGPRLRLIVEPDEGMYDAINRGILKSKGDVIAHLNADEQYLPGALAAVAEQFEKDPGLDVLLADSVIVDADGEFICCRKSLKPQRLTRFADNPTITSSIFMRRSAVVRHQLYFDTNWRVLSDSMWIRKCVVTPGLKMGVLRSYTTTFTESGDNLDLSPRAREESLRLRARRPLWAKLLEKPLKLVARVRRWVLGGYRQEPLEYSIFTRSDFSSRTSFSVERPTCVWWTRAPRNAGGLYRKIKQLAGRIGGHDL